MPVKGPVRQQATQNLNVNELSLDQFFELTEAKSINPMAEKQRNPRTDCGPTNCGHELNNSAAYRKAKADYLRISTNFERMIDEMRRGAHARTSGKRSNQNRKCQATLSLSGSK